MKRKPIIGIMGPGDPNSDKALKTAFELGRHIAKNDWILLTGGRFAGVMNEASKGAASENGIIIGILPGSDLSQMSPHVTIPIRTGMGHARNAINVLSSDIVIVCGFGAGTVSEASLSLKMNKPTGFICMSDSDFSLFRRLSDKAEFFNNNTKEIMEWTIKMVRLKKII
ncbi:MAG: cytochrome [Balneolaceae bacterium]